MLVHSSPRRSFLFVSMIALAALASAQDKALPTDPSFVQGELPNGLRYVIRQHANPPGRAVAWLHIHSGSLNETDRQRGIAHYLEHMAFNGSENFAPGTVVPFFQSLGMTFGRDQNAFTSFDQTTYQLSLPDTSTETLGKGLTFLSDVLSRLSLLPAEIDAERQIILEERRRGLSARQRTGDLIMERMTPGSRFGKRSPIGTEETILGVQQSDFRDYYEAWYTASNATVMVVADCAPEQVRKQIEAHFGAAPRKPRPAPEPAGVRPYEKSFAIVATDPELRSESIRIARVEKARPAVNTETLYRAELAAQLGRSAFNRRLEEKVAAGGTSYLSARASAGNEVGAMYSAEISARPNPGAWRPALQEVALELQRARSFGFGSREIDDVKKQILSGAERSVETEANATAQALIGRINGSITQGEPLMSPTQRLELLRRLLPTISAEEITAAFRAEFDPGAVAFIATLPTAPGVPSEDELLEIGKQALAATPTREAEIARADKLMDTPPPAGKIAEGSEHSASGVWSGWLANNVRVHHRFMDVDKNEVSISITLYGGEVLETAETRGLTQAAQLAWSRPATRKLSSTDIRELMTGKKVAVRGGGGMGGRRGGRGGGGGGAGGAGISMTVSGSPEELESGMQLAYLLLTEPKIEPSAFEQFQTTTREMLQEVTKNPTALGARLASALPYPDAEVRNRPLSIEQIERITLPSAQGWLERLITTAPIEVAIVGDLSRERALELAARYLGGLPARERVSPTLHAELRKIERPRGPRIVRETVQTETKQAYVMSGFYGADQSNLSDSHALSMAARILSTRMVKQVREEAQLVYSIGASSRAASMYPGFGVFSAAAPTEPAKCDALVAKLREMYAEFAAKGPTEEELTVARKQMANTYAEQTREAGYWARRLDNLTFLDTKLDDVLAEPSAFQALTADQIRTTFAKYYAEQNELTVVVRPSADVAAPPTAGTR